MTDVKKNNIGENTNVNQLELYQNIVDRAHKEIEYVHSAYKWLLAILTIIILAGMAFTYKSAVDFKNEIKMQGVSLNETLVSKMSECTSRLDSNFAQLEIKVNSRIDNEFEKENIHKLVQDKAQRRIEEIADSLIEQKIAEQLSPKMKEADLKLAQIDEKNIIAQQNLDALQLQAKFMIVILAAQNDDREAFDQLSWVCSFNCVNGLNDLNSRLPL